MSILRSVENLFARLIRYSTVSRTSPDGYDQVKGWDVEEGYAAPARRLQWYGFRSRPPLNSEAILLANNGSRGDKVIVAADHSGYGPQDQAEEEVTVYSSKGQRIMLTEDGSLSLYGGEHCQILMQHDVETLVNGRGAIVVLRNDRVSIDSEIETPRIYFSGSPPTAMPSNPNVTVAQVIEGNDSVFKLSLKVAPMPAAGVLCIVTYSRAWNSAPIVSLSTSEKITATTTNATITLNTPALAVGSYELVITSFGII